MSETSNVADVLPPLAAERNMIQAAKGGGITFAGKLFTFACRLVITFLMARFLGAGQYGLYNLALTSLTVAAALAAFGLDTALVRYIAMFAHRGDSARVWGTLQLGLGITLALSLLISCGLYVLSDMIAMQIFHEPRLASMLRLASVVVPFLTLSNVLASATQGFKKMQYATIARDIVQPLVRLLLIVGLVVVGANAVGALAVYGVAVVVSASMLLYFLNGKLFSLRRPLRDGHRETREVLGFSAPVFLSDLMTTFRDNVQTLLLGALSTVTSVGIFAVANQMNMVGSMFQSAIAVASRPIISELYDKGDCVQLGRMYQTTTKWALTANLPMFLTLVLFPTQILSIFGRSFVSGSTALVLLACAIMADVSTGQCGIILDMTGHAMWKLINSIVRLALSLGLSVLLIPHWGVVGAAASTLLVVSTINIMRLLQVFFLFRLLPYNATFVKPIVAGLAALLSTLALGYWLPSTNPLYTALRIIILFTVYASAILLLGLSAEDRAVLARLRRRMRSKLSRSGGK
jgi:O-antigen/teichoic acid export membrane protein